MSNRKDLKSFVRYDGTGRLIAGSLILRKQKPRVGKWEEVDTYLCCNPIPGGSFLLTEDNGYLLQENGGRILL
jgi:hypothetical protein